MIARQIVIVLLSKTIALGISTFTRRGAVDRQRLEQVAEENRDGSRCHRLRRGTAGWLRSFVEDIDDAGTCRAFEEKDAV